MMDDSGVHCDRDDSRTSFTSFTSEPSSPGALSMVCESCEDVRYSYDSECPDNSSASSESMCEDVSFDSHGCSSMDGSVDLQCWEQTSTFSSLTPIHYNTDKLVQKNINRVGKRKSVQEVVRRSQRLRQKSGDAFSANSGSTWVNTTTCMSVSPTTRPPSPPPLKVTKCKEVIVKHYTDKKKLEAAELADDVEFVCHESIMYKHRKDMEMFYHPYGSLNRQPKVNEGLRAILVEWMTKMCYRLEVKLDTLFLSINVMDRFLITTPISTNCVQLLGLTAVLIASKMNEIFPPPIGDLLLMATDNYSKTQVKQLERLVLTRIRFNLLAPTSLFFMEYHALWHMRRHCFLKSSFKEVKESRMMARHLLELALQDYDLYQFRPSLLAHVALQQADIMLCQHNRYIALDHAGYTMDQYKDCTEKFQSLSDGVLSNLADFDEIFTKYAQSYGNIDKLDWDAPGSF